jgi:predicted amidohydrolase
MMRELTVAAIQMDSQVGAVEANLAHATTLVEQAASQGAQLIAVPEVFSAGYVYSDLYYDLPEAINGPTGSWIVETARRLGVHLVGSFPARMAEGAYIVAMLAAPDGRTWVYRKIHVAIWENCYFERGSEPLIAETDLGRIGFAICWDEVFADLARAYQGRVDLLCIPSSPPTFVGQVENEEGEVVAPLEAPSMLGSAQDPTEMFSRAQELHAQTAGVPVVYAARCGTFHSRLPFGGLYLGGMGLGNAWRVLRATGTGYYVRCPMMGRSSILNAQGERIVRAGEAGEAVLVAKVQAGAPDPESLPPVPEGRYLVPGVPVWMSAFEQASIPLGSWYRRRRGRG